MNVYSWHWWKTFLIFLGSATLVIVVLANEEWSTRLVELLFLLFFAHPDALPVFMLALAAGILIVARILELDWLTSFFLAWAVTCVVVLVLYYTLLYIWWW